MMLEMAVLLFWMVFSGLSVHVTDKYFLRTIIQDYQVKRPRILAAIGVAMIWIALSIVVLAIVI